MEFWPKKTEYLPAELESVIVILCVYYYYFARTNLVGMLFGPTPLFTFILPIKTWISSGVAEIEIEIEIIYFQIKNKKVYN